MSEYNSKQTDKISPELFWESVNILITKPHVINNRLWGNKVWFKCNCVPVNPDQETPKCCKKLNEIISIENIERSVSHILKELKLVPDKNTIDFFSKIEVILIELLPKSYSANHAFQLICLDKNKIAVTFYDVSPENSNQNLCPEFPYSLKLSTNNNEIELIASCDLNSKSFMWLKKTVVPQVKKWAEESITRNNDKYKSIFCNESLSLISQIKYYEKYHYLKLKYGKELVKIWPECTDPSKFVYEDIAIATYLMLLWEADDISKKQSFVDLGCGNGLLVYILTKEGHVGVGIDVRKRQIWDMYSDDIRLEERTITPSDFSLFPETDWIIGNHSDELTPWIPIIAAKSSFKCKFFVLPCCTYNFDGTKYQRRNSCKSQYTEYLEYIKELCVDCGFAVHMDRLKIPSTKRVCLVGQGRTYSCEEYDKYCHKLQAIINRDSIQEYEKDTCWIKDFKPRESVERVRNCTQVDKTLIESIVNCIANYLILECNSHDTNWSSGKIVELNEVVQLIPQEQLNILKSECGGIKTLIKNNHHIFKVESGKVQLRYPRTIEEVTNKLKANKSKAKSNNIKIQQRLCWFYKNHPQGCPLTEANCSFLHVES